MKTKFKVGDKVLLTNPEEGIWGQWARGDCKEGTEYTVSRVYSNDDGGSYIDMDGVMLTHRSCQFDLVKPDVITIILRRPVDRKNIEKFLFENGFRFENENPDAPKDAKEKSRIINVHFTGRHKGEITYNAPVVYGMPVKEAIKRNNDFMLSFFGHNEIRVMKSKPSVNQLINELKRYM